MILAMTHHPIAPESVAAMSDADLLAAYQRTNGEVGDAEADALAAEIERRELDV